MPKLEREGATPEPWSDRDFAERMARDDAFAAGPPAVSPRSRRAASHEDARLEDDVRRALASGEDSTSTVRVTVRDRVVVLEGAVADRATKAACQALARGLPRVRDVDNRLCVDWVDATPDRGREAAAPAPRSGGYLTSIAGTPTSTGRRTE